MLLDKPALPSTPSNTTADIENRTPSADDLDGQSSSKPNALRYSYKDGTYTDFLSRKSTHAVNTVCSFTNMYCCRSMESS